MELMVVQLNRYIDDKIDAMGDDFDENQVGGSVEDPIQERLANVLDVAMDPRDKIKMYSRVNTLQRTIIPKMSVVGDFINDDHTAKYIKDWLELGVSENGLGRKEVVEIFRAWGNYARTRLENIRGMLSGGHP